MHTGTGSGLIGLGIVLAVVGAIMRYAVTTTTEGFDLFTAGGILLLVGILAVIVGIILVVAGGRRSTTTREEIAATPTGSQRVTEREGWAG
jgi:uncharacterized membrane protein YidH (DUF202 family)